MSARRGRKKAAPKAAATVQQAADVLDIQELQEPGPIMPTAPPSPIVAIAKHAMSPVVAAATKIVAIAASALPAIPEAAAVDANALEIDDHPSSSPRSPPASAQHDPFTAAADLDTLGQQHAITSNHEYTNTINMQQQNSLDEKMDLQHGPTPSTVTAAETAKRLQDYLNSMISNLDIHRNAVLQAMQGVLLLTLLGFVLSQGSCLRTQQATIATQQQQVQQQASSLHTLQGQLHRAQQELQALPNMQQLHKVEASCSAGLGGLQATHSSLYHNIQALEMLAQQLEANFSSISQTTQLGVEAYKLVTAAGAANPDATSRHSYTNHAATADLPVSALLQHNLQQSKQVLEALSATVQHEVQQQLAAQLPPVNLALADCGARVVFHSPLNATALQAAAVLTASRVRSDGAGGMHWVQQRVKQLLWEHLPNSVIGQQQRQQQQMPLMTIAQINSIMLRPQAAETAEALAAVGGTSQALAPCVSLLLGSGNSTTAQTAAVVEIALPQLMTIESVTLHNHAQSSRSQYNSLYSSAPGAAVIAVANSSTCSMGMCSAVGQLAVTNSSRSAEAHASKTGGMTTSVLAHGALGVQQTVEMDADNSRSRHAIVRFHHGDAPRGGAGVVADRVVIHVTRSMSGGEDVCMGRVSVQGKPVDPAAFC